MEKQFSSLFSKYGKIGAIIELCRPWNGIVMFLLVIASSVLISDRFIFSSLLGGLVFLIMYMAGTILNDIFDYNVDKVNMPYRPLQRGSVSIKESSILSLLLYLLSLSIAVYLGSLFFLLAMIFFILSLVYSLPKIYLVGKPLIGNIVLAIVSILIPLISGYILVTNEFIFFNKFLFAFISFTIFFIFVSLLKDLKDVKGDKKFGKKTLATFIGEKKTFFISFGGIISFFPLNILFFNSLIQNLFFILTGFILYFLFLLTGIQYIKDTKHQKEKIFSKARMIILFYIIFLIVFSFL